MDNAVTMFIWLQSKWRAYKHTVVLGTFSSSVEINKSINAKFIPLPNKNNSKLTYYVDDHVNQVQSRHV